jgi:hypothetical protein
MVVLQSVANQHDVAQMTISLNDLAQWHHSPPLLFIFLPIFILCYAVLSSKTCLINDCIKLLLPCCTCLSFGLTLS